MPLKLRPVVQHYDWGKGINSYVGRFAKEVLQEIKPPFAELWLGAHPKAPSMLEINGAEISLDKLISQHPLLILGEKTYSTFGPQLPFLFKILSIDTALSIQAHPDKAFASVLHKRDPANYPDTNHKPEVAIALTEVPMLHGFREVGTIIRFVQNVPELGALLGNDLISSNPTLKSIYETLLRAPKELVKEQSKMLGLRIQKKGPSSLEEEWILKLSSRFPEGDIGLFSFYILNLFTLAPGEALYTPPNVAHAYLGGELIECMANSDNVVRAGLTSKFKDEEALLQMLIFESSEAQPLQTKEEELGLKCFLAPTKEFQLETIALFQQAVHFSTANSVQLLFCLEGEALLSSLRGKFLFQPGVAALLPAAMSDYSLESQGGVLCRVSVPT